jgi:hypothetical protein
MRLEGHSMLKNAGLLILLFCAAPFAAAQTLEVSGTSGHGIAEGEARLRALFAPARAEFHFGARTMTRHGVSRTEGFLKVATTVGLNHVALTGEVRGLAVAGSEAVMEGPAVLVVRNRQGIHRFHGTMRAVVVDNRHPTSATGHPDRIRVVFHVSDGPLFGFGGDVVRGDIVVHRRTHGR